VSVPAHAQATAHAAAATPASVRVTVVRSAQSTPQRTVLAVRVDGRGLVLGSYEGNLSFDPAAFALDSAIVGRDGSRFVNAGAAKTGAVRFAGFTTTGFTSADAITLIGRALKPLEQSHVTASITVAGDLDGRKVPKAGLIGATGITAAR
jgi:hypothetical protein